jgi:hypothetical protein
MKKISGIFRGREYPNTKSIALNRVEPETETKKDEMRA